MVWGKTVIIQKNLNKGTMYYLKQLSTHYMSAKHIENINRSNFDKTYESLDERAVLTEQQKGCKKARGPMN